MVSGNSPPHTERRGRAGSAAIFVFPLVGKHLLANDDIRTAKTRAALEHAPDFTAVHRNYFSAPLNVQRVYMQTRET